MCFAGIHASNAFFCQNIHGEQKFIHVWGGKACQAEFRVSWEHCSQRGNSWIIQSHTYHPPPHQQFTLSCAPIRENCGKQKHFRLQTKAIATVWAIMVIRHPPPHLHMTSASYLYPDADKQDLDHRNHKCQMFPSYTPAFLYFLQLLLYYRSFYAISVSC